MDKTKKSRRPNSTRKPKFLQKKDGFDLSNWEDRRDFESCEFAIREDDRGDKVLHELNRRIAKGEAK